MASSGADDDAPGALDARRGFDDAELAACLKVLRALGDPGDGVPPVPAAAADDDVSAESSSPPARRVSPLFHHRAHKPVRVALQPLLGALRDQLGHYGKDPKAFRASKQSKRDLNRRKMQERAADRESLDKTRMRAERLARLAALEAGHADLAETRHLPSAADAASGEDAAAVEFSGGGAPPPTGPRRFPLVPDGCAGASERVSNASPRGVSDGVLRHPRQCYACKRRYRELHHFYASLCPECAELNWTKRHQTADLRGRVALVTGARVKIGFRIALKLLRCGAAVVATTRFPVDARARFEREPDARAWLDRLTVLAMDLRDLPGLERLCARLNAELPRLDVLVNNACQTVRRPPAYYRHLLRAEAEGFGAFVESAGRGEKHELLSRVREVERVEGGGGARAIGGGEEEERDSGAEDSASADASAVASLRGAGWMAPSAAFSQLELLPSDAAAPDRSARQFPSGALDVNGQQVDLRAKTSWTTKLGEVETPELLEVLAVNAAAPFVLNGKLRTLMERTAATRDGGRADAGGGGGGGGDGGATTSPGGAAFVINVSAMEGKFYRYKTPNHPHTNMAKAALNMMTATSAAEYAERGVYMNAVDTGWINDENPLETAARIAEVHGFQTPIDEEDAAARCVAPALEGFAAMSLLGEDAPTPPFGKFFKDYRETEW